MHIVVNVPCTETQRRKIEDTVRKYDTSVFFLKNTQEEKQFQEEEGQKLLQNAAIIIGEPDLDTIHQNSNLQWVQMTWAGTDKYTTRAAVEKDSKKTGFPKDVILTNMSGAFGMIMSEYAIGAILQVYRRFPAYLEQQKKHIWKDAGSEECLYGKRVLLLGTGDVGSSVAQKCKAFGMYTVGIRRKSENTNAYFDEMHGFDSLDDELKKADIVVCSLPNKPNTRNLLTRQRLLAMKRNAILLNMGRGTLLDTKELAMVLQEGHLRAAILDVTDEEPLPKENPLWTCENVFITPHIAGPSIGHCAVTQDIIVEACCENLNRYFTGQSLLHKIEDNDFEYDRK